MTDKIKQLEEKLSRLTIALNRLSKDKKDARQTLMADIQKVQQEIVQARQPAPANKSMSLTTIVLASFIIAIAIGFISYFSTGGSL